METCVPLQSIPAEVLQQMIYDIIAQAQTRNSDALNILGFVMARVVSQGAWNPAAAENLINVQIPKAILRAYRAIYLHEQELRAGTPLH